MFAISSWQTAHNRVLPLLFAAGKSLSDDQTAATSSRLAAPPRPASRDCATQADDLPPESPVTDEPPTPTESGAALIAGEWSLARPFWPAGALGAVIAPHPSSPPLTGLLSSFLVQKTLNLSWHLAWRL